LGGREVGATDSWKLPKPSAAMSLSAESIPAPPTRTDSFSTILGNLTSPSAQMFDSDKRQESGAWVEGIRRPCLEPTGSLAQGEPPVHPEPEWL